MLQEPDRCIALMELPLQVSWDWNLDSTIVFKAVNYLDHFLTTKPVEVLTRWA